MSSRIPSVDDMTSENTTPPVSSTSRRTVTAAVVQAAGPLFDTPAALARAEELIRDAAQNHGAEVIVLPEAFLGGYPKGLDFGIAVGSRTPAGRELFRRYYAAAIEVPGPERRHPGRRHRGTWLPRSWWAWSSGDGGTLYCTALFFGPDGVTWASTAS